MIGVVTNAWLDWLPEPLGNPFNPAVTPCSMSENFAPMNFYKRLLNTITYYMINFSYKSNIVKQDEHVKKYFGSGYPSVIELTKDIDLLLVNSHYSIEGISPFTAAIIPVGGLHINEDGTQLPYV